VGPLASGPDIDDLLAIAHEKVTRSLTKDKSRQYLHADAEAGGSFVAALD
jgi:hypothetical protein